MLKDNQWLMDRLLREQLNLFKTKGLTRYSLECWVLQLESVLQSMNLEIIGARKETGVTSLNHDDENRSLL